MKSQKLNKKSLLFYSSECEMIKHVEGSTWRGQKGTTKDIETKHADLAWSKQKVLLVFLE